jgi:hypothetical protein
MMMGSVLKEVREVMCLSNLPSVCSPNEEMFEALFKGVSTQLGPRTMEKCVDNPHCIFCHIRTSSFVHPGPESSVVSSYISSSVPNVAVATFNPAFASHPLGIAIVLHTAM